MELKPWGMLTPEEKGALLLAQHEGKVIERRDRFGKTWSAGIWNFKDANIYRVRPEPERETVWVSGMVFPHGRWVFGSLNQAETHIIKFDTLDGEPVCDSIRMEKIE